jgi:hypothetical protein
MSRLAERGAVKGTRDCHRRLLRVLAAMNSDRLAAAYKAMPLPTAIVEWMDCLRKRSGWIPRTMVKYLASIAGALSALPLYRSGAPAINLNAYPEWRQSLLGAAKAAQRTLPKAPKGATKEDVAQAIRQEPKLYVKAALILSWVVAGRTGDVARLQKQHVVLREDGTVTVTWLETKTSSRTGPRSITTSMPPEWMPILRRWHEARNSWLFPANNLLNGEIRTALRRVSPVLECRSLRRGALETMALAGTPTETLLIFSGHTTERMLLVYLGWGRQHADRTSRTAAAGAALIPTSMTL